MDMNPAIPEPIFTIRSCYYGHFLANFEKMARRARKINGSEIRAEIVEIIERKTGEDAYGRDMFDDFYRVRVDAEPVKIEGYTFLAVIDHINDAGNIVKVLPNTGAELPVSYRTAKPFCQHCNSLRTRRNTFVLRCDATGEMKQIGKNCFADFIGRDPKQVAAWAMMLGTMVGGGDSEDDFDGAYGMRDLRYIALFTYLGHTAAIMRVHGWMSGKTAKAHGGEEGGMKPTSERAHLNMEPPKARKGEMPFKVEKVTDEDRKLARAAIDWVLTLDKRRNLSDYEHNILVLAKSPYIERKSEGFAASIIPTYLRAQEKAAIAKKKAVGTENSVHVGAINERIEFGKVRVVAAFSGLSGGFEVHRYRFATAEGNLLLWSASKTQELIQGDEVTLVGTVKRHDEYEGMKRTYITRCKIEPVA